MGVGAAIVGGSIVGGVLSSRSASKSARAARQGAEASADATLQATLAQLDELGYQFDYSQAALASGRQMQYNAQNAFGTMLGINGPSTASASSSNNVRRYAPQSSWRQRQWQPATARQPQGGGGFMRNAVANAIWRQQQQQGRSNKFYDSDGNYIGPIGSAPGVGQNEIVSRSGDVQRFGPDSDFHPTVGDRGFVDPMADPTRLAGDTLEDDTLYGNVIETRLAGDTYEADPFFNYAEETGGMDQVKGNLLAGTTYQDDPYFSQVQDSAYTPDMLTSDTFEASPGYQFQLEQGMQALENRNSAGGNFGGRAMKEALRYSQGVASQDYYNWANLRQRDLLRQDTADQYQLGREDTAMQNYLGRRQTDAGRMDQQFNIDTARKDQAFMDYLNRQGIDANRMDNATLNYLARQQYDVQRNDQNYANFMARLAATAGLGSDVADTVATSQNTGGQMANVYQNQGNQLSNIYQNRGNTLASIEQGRYAGLNNAIQGGISNYMLYQMLQA